MINIGVWIFVCHGLSERILRKLEIVSGYVHLVFAHIENVFYDVK